MIQLLLFLLFVEMSVLTAMMIRSPLRKLVIVGIDGLGHGRGLVFLRTIGASVLVLLVSIANNMRKIQSRSSEVGAVTPTDQVLWSRHLLEASLMGYLLFLALIAVWMHRNISEHHESKTNMEMVANLKKALEEAKSTHTEELEVLEREILELKAKNAELRAQSEAREKEVKAAEASCLALRRQSEGFLIEYDRLLEDNQNLRSQLKSIDRKLSHSDSKKLL